MTLEKGKFPQVSVFITKVLGIVSYLHANRKVVLPAERKAHLLPFVKLCYNKDSPFNVKSPKFFAYLLYIAVDFRKSNDSDASLSVEEIDYEIQKLKRTLLDD